MEGDILVVGDCGTGKLLSIAYLSILLLLLFHISHFTFDSLHLQLEHYTRDSAHNAYPKYYFAGQQCNEC